MFEPEVWVTVAQNDNYKVSNYGRIKNADTGRMMALRVNKDGHGGLYVRLNHNAIQVARYVSHIVGAAFLKGYDDRYVMVHQDGDLTNNHIDNLIQDYGRHKVSPRG